MIDSGETDVLLFLNAERAYTDAAVECQKHALCTLYWFMDDQIDALKKVVQELTDEIANLKMGGGTTGKEGGFKSITGVERTPSPAPIVPHGNNFDTVSLGGISTKNASQEPLPKRGNHVGGEKGIESKENNKKMPGRWPSMSTMSNEATQDNLRKYNSNENIFGTPSINSTAPGKHSTATNYAAAQSGRVATSNQISVPQGGNQMTSHPTPPRKHYPTSNYPIASGGRDAMPKSPTGSRVHGKTSRHGSASRSKVAIDDPDITKGFDYQD